MLVKEAKKILITEKEIKSLIKDFAPTLNKYYKKKEKPIILGVLKGCVLFQANLVIYLDFDSHYEFISINKDKNQDLNNNDFKIEWLTKGNIENRNVLIVDNDDHLGITLKKLKKYLIETKKAKEVKIVTLIEKPHFQKTNFKPDWSIIKINTKGWIIGWSFDYDQRLRNLPYISLLKDEYKNG